MTLTVSPVGGFLHAVSLSSAAWSRRLTQPLFASAERHALLALSSLWTGANGRGENRVHRIQYSVVALRKLYVRSLHVATFDRSSFTESHQIVPRNDLAHRKKERVPCGGKRCKRSASILNVPCALFGPALRIFQVAASYTGSPAKHFLSVTPWTHSQALELRRTSLQ